MVLVPFLGTFWKVNVDGVLLFLGDVSGPFGLSSFILGRFFLLSVGLGLGIKWAGVVKFFNPTIIYG